MRVVAGKKKEFYPEEKHVEFLRVRGVEVITSATEMMRYMTVRQSFIGDLSSQPTLQNLAGNRWVFGLTATDERFMALIEHFNLHEYFVIEDRDEDIVTGQVGSVRYIDSRQKLEEFYHEAKELRVRGMDDAVDCFSRVKPDDFVNFGMRALKLYKERDTSNLELDLMLTFGFMIIYDAVEKLFGGPAPVASVPTQVSGEWRP